MQTVRSLFTRERMGRARRHAGVLALVLLAGLLFGSVKARGDDTQLAVYLGSPSTGYVNVTSYLVIDQYGNVWVDGYDNEADFEIILDAADGQVLDPYGNQKGYFTGPAPA